MKAGFAAGKIRGENFAKSLVFRGFGKTGVAAAGGAPPVYQAIRAI
jgi:hypothetical protein